MRQYLALARAEMLDTIQEKGEMAIWFILELIPVLVMGSLWISNQDRTPILGVKQLVTYYFVVLASSRLTDFWFDNYMQENIRTGQFSKWLLKPVRTPLMFIPSNIGSKLFSVPCTLLPVLLIFSIVFGKYLVLPNWGAFLLFAMSLVNGFLIKYSLATAVSAGAFFWDQSRALLHLKWASEMIFGGYALPLSLYPLWLQRLTDVLPFKNEYYVPASIFTGVFDARQSLTAIFQGGVWSAVLLAASLWFWKKGIRKFSAVGG